jgi:hypothetical protein
MLLRSQRYFLNPISLDSREISQRLQYDGIEIIRVLFNVYKMILHACTQRKLSLYEPIPRQYALKVLFGFLSQ